MSTCNRICTFILILFFALFANQINAQRPHFKNLNLSKGKKNLSVNTIFQDKSGYIWFGTTDGLIKFDGINYTNYTTENNLAENFVTSIGQDSENNIWIGHKNGRVSILSRDSMKRFSLLDSLLTEPVSGFLFLDKQIWIASLGNGLFMIQDNKIERFNSESPVGDDYIYDIKYDKSGNLWFASDIGILKYKVSQNNWENFSMKDGLPDNIVKSIEIDEEGKVWLGLEESGLCLFNPENNEITLIPMWKFGPVNQIASRNKGEIWISTRSDGIIRLNYTNIYSYGYKCFQLQNGLIDNKTNCVFRDNENNIWIGANKGLSLITGDLFEFLTLNEGLPSNEIFSFIIDSNTNYWICSKKGLFILKKSVTGEFTSKQLLAGSNFDNHSFTSLYEDSKGYVWVGTYGYGVYRFSKNADDFKSYNTDQGLANNNIIHITGKDNLVWFSTFGGGVDYCNISENTPIFHNISSKDGLGSNYIYSSYTDTKNRIWFAKDGGGVAFKDKNTISKFKEEDSISNVVYGISEDSNGNIWFTTSNQGILKYSDGKFTRFGPKDKLLSRSYQSLIFDIFGNGIFASNDGISVYNKESGLFQNYTEEDGVSYMEPNLNAIFKDITGDIWIGNNNGLIKYNPHAIKEQKVYPKILITKIKASDFELTKSNEVLSHKQNHLEFNFIGLWYKAPGKLMYRYKLEGHDPDWSDETKSLVANYSSLPPGKFTFKVQVSVEPGIWTDSQMESYSFQIKPPLWKRLWFIITLTLIIITSVYLFFRLRLAALQKAKQRLELEVLKRTAEIERQRDIIEMKNKNITDSILYASRIQTAILPPDELLSENLPNHFVYFKPRDIVSGDFYWINRKEDEIVVVVADCTGHGVPGAFMSMLGIAFLNEIVNRAEQLKACDILNELRDYIKKSLRQSGKKDEAKDGMDISLCIVNIARKTIQFAGAYNPLYMVRNGEIILIKADRMPIGIYYKEKDSFTNHTESVQSGDVIYLFSDGYVDQFGGSEGKKFLVKQFQQMILDIHQKPLPEQKEILSATFEHWKGKYEQVDDILVLGFRID